MKSSIVYIFFLILCIEAGFGQTGVIRGRVFNEINNEGLAFGSVFLQETRFGSYTDSLGNFEIKNLPPGLYNVEARYGGFKSAVIYEVQVTNSKPYVLEIPMVEDVTVMDSVNIVASPFKDVEEAPLSLRTIGTNEIQRNPGGNRDISRVIQSLPGVASTITFRNDILIRGGGPNENRFYIDGIETPNINHFATQGASGGPVGLLNVDFIGEVDFYSGAFPANRGNALSSVFNFQQRPARDDRLGFTATVGSSDLALTLEGPTGENSSFLFSARRSYLEFLFKLLGLPFLPAYNDFQYKHNFKFGERHELNIVGLGAVDDFSLNLEADSTDFQKYILGNLPVNTQWNYTIGASYKYYGDKGFWQFVLSRNMINFNASKFRDNNEAGQLLLDYTSQESENKARLEYTGRQNGWKWNYGANYELARYTNDTYSVRRFGIIDFESSLLLNKYGAFAQISKRLLEDRLTLSLGARIDGNDFSEKTRNPFEQFSPRFSASFALLPQLTINFNAGTYYQLPPYTVLGYRDNQNELVNTDITYIKSNHLVSGFSFTTARNSRISVEAYYKTYDNYPFLTNDSISLANVGGDFGVVGNEPAIPSSQGRAYGLELSIQQRLYKGFYGILAYTIGRSEFTDKDGNFAPSSWDNRHVVALTLGKKFGKNWEIGAKWRFTSGPPYTPANVSISSLRSVWDIRGAEVPDFANRLNTERFQAYHQLDMRIDKKWFLKKWSLNVFFDVQNVYGYEIPGAPILNVVTDEFDQPIVDPNDPSRYQTYFIEDALGIFQPSIGIVVSY